MFQTKLGVERLEDRDAPSGTEPIQPGDFPTPPPPLPDQPPPVIAPTQGP